MKDFLLFITKKIHEIENPKRVAVSRRFPRLKPVIIGSKRFFRNAQYIFDKTARRTYVSDFFPQVLARHSSPLMRKLGSSDPKLQEKKIINLRLAAEKLNGLVIPPGKVFSFWKAIGNPSKEKGYVEAMLISEGKVIEGQGGGLCQMSNLLFWLFLHTPVEVVERFHHSRDAFPDSGRTLPFGSGATVFYNLIDLQIKNTTDQPLQLKVWLTDTQLKGQVLAGESEPRKFHVYEKNHCFIKKGENYYRFNELWRDEVVGGKITKSEKLYTNFAPVMYEVNEGYLKAQNIDFITIS
jgi:vancomycin resistance protein VanW